MPDVRFDLATPDDAAELARIHTRAAENLTARFGAGHWSRPTTERGILSSLRDQPRHSQTWVARRGAAIVGSFRLQTKKPWAIDRAYFSPAARPLYLTGMAVDPSAQRQGIGRACVDAMLHAALAWPADTIRLDAYDHAAGAGGFYAGCGFVEVGRVVYRGDALVYFEMVLGAVSV